MAQEVGFLPPTWETWLVFLAPDKGFNPVPAIVHIWKGGGRVNKRMRGARECVV